jgi:hypothetical protein
MRFLPINENLPSTSRVGLKASEQSLTDIGTAILHVIGIVVFSSAATVLAELSFCLSIEPRDHMVARDGSHRV